MAHMRITSGKGVHFNLENGITLSIQIGGGNYCDNYDAPIYTGDRGYVLPPSQTAEIAAWADKGEMVNLGCDTVRGRVPVDEVLSFLEFLRAIKSPVSTETLQSAVADFEWSDDAK